MFEKIEVADLGGQKSQQEEGKKNKNLYRGVSLGFLVFFLLLWYQSWTVTKKAGETGRLMTFEYVSASLTMTFPFGLAFPATLKAGGGNSSVLLAMAFVTSFWTYCCVDLLKYPAEHDLVPLISWGHWFISVCVLWTRRKATNSTVGVLAAFSIISFSLGLMQWSKLSALNSLFDQQCAELTHGTAVGELSWDFVECYAQNFGQQCQAPDAWMEFGRSEDFASVLIGNESMTFRTTYFMLNDTAPYGWYSVPNYTVGISANEAARYVNTISLDTEWWAKAAGRGLAMLNVVAWNVHPWEFGGLTTARIEALDVRFVDVMFLISPALHTFFITFYAFLGYELLGYVVTMCNVMTALFSSWLLLSPRQEGKYDEESSSLFWRLVQGGSVLGAVVVTWASVFLHLDPLVAGSFVFLVSLLGALAGNMASEFGAKSIWAHCLLFMGCFAAISWFDMEVPSVVDTKIRAGVDACFAFFAAWAIRLIVQYETSHQKRPAQRKVLQGMIAVNVPLLLTALPMVLSQLFLRRVFMLSLCNGHEMWCDVDAVTPTLGMEEQTGGQWSEWRFHYEMALKRGEQAGLIVIIAILCGALPRYYAKAAHLSYESITRVGLHFWEISLCVCTFSLFICLGMANVFMWERVFLVQRILGAMCLVMFCMSLFRYMQLSPELEVGVQETQQNHRSRRQSIAASDALERDVGERDVEDTAAEEGVAKDDLSDAGSFVYWLMIFFVTALDWGLFFVQSVVWAKDNSINMLANGTLLINPMLTASMPLAALAAAKALHLDEYRGSTFVALLYTSAKWIFIGVWTTAADDGFPISANIKPGLIIAALLLPCNLVIAWDMWRCWTIDFGKLAWRLTLTLPATIAATVRNTGAGFRAKLTNYQYATPFLGAKTCSKLAQIGGFFGTEEFYTANNAGFAQETWGFGDMLYTRLDLDKHDPAAHAQKEWGVYLLNQTIVFMSFSQAIVSTYLVTFPSYWASRTHLSAARVQAGLKVREWVNIVLHFFMVLAVVANMGLRQPLTQIVVLVMVLLCCISLAVVLCGHSDAQIQETQRRSTFESRRSVVSRKTIASNNLRNSQAARESVNTLLESQKSVDDKPTALEA